MKIPKYLALGVNGDGVGEGQTSDEAISDLQDRVLNLWDGEFKIEEVVVYEVKRMGQAKITIEWK